MQNYNHFYLVLLQTKISTFQMAMLSFASLMPAPKTPSTTLYDRFDALYKGVHIPNVDVRGIHNYAARFDKIYDESYIEIDKMVPYVMELYRDSSIRAGLEYNEEDNGQAIALTTEFTAAHIIQSAIKSTYGINVDIGKDDCKRAFKAVVEKQIDKIKAEADAKENTGENGLPRAADEAAHESSDSDADNLDGAARVYYADSDSDSDDLDSDDLNMARIYDEDSDSDLDDGAAHVVYDDQNKIYAEDERIAREMQMEEDYKMQLKQALQESLIMEAKRQNAIKNEERKAMEREAEAKKKYAEVTKTGIYLIENSKNIIRAVNDVYHQYDDKHDIIDPKSAYLNTGLNVLHSGLSVANSIYTGGTVAPIANTVVYTLRSNTDLLESDNAYYQCAIDMAASSLMHLVTFNIYGASVAAGLGMAKCVLPESAQPAISIAQDINGLVNAANPLIKGFEGLKLVYDLYDSGVFSNWHDG